jgi:hypothetical protein
MTGIEVYIADFIVMNTAVDIVAAQLIATIAVDLAVAVTISAITSSLFKSGSDQSRELTQMIRLSDAPHKFLYGTRLASGLIAYMKTSADHLYLYMILVLAAHEVNAIGDIWFNDKPATDYDSNYYTVTKHLGTDTQAADTTFVSDLAEWTSAHQLKGRAYLAIKLKGNRAIWPTGIPLVRAVVEGKKVYDPRDGTTAFSNNPALCIRDYLLTAKESGGLGAESTEIDDDYFDVAANICDELITVPVGFPDTYAITGATQANPVQITAVGHTFINGQLIEIDEVVGMTELNGNSYYVASAGTDVFSLSGVDGTGYGAYVSGGKASEPIAFTTQARYTLDGPVDTGLQPVDIIKQMLTSCRGAMIYVSGRYRLFAGAYSAPTHTITDSDLRGPFSAIASMARKDLFNGIRGRYPNPDERYQVTDFPPYQDADYVALDNGDVIWRDVEYQYTTDVYRAQRLSKIEVEKSRRGRVVNLPCKLTKMNVSVWDTVTLSLDSCPDISGVYRVESFSFTPDENGLGVDLTLREEGVMDWAWEYTDSVIPEPAPSISDDTITQTAAPTNLSAVDEYSDEYYVDVLLSWDAITFDGIVYANISKYDDIETTWIQITSVALTSGVTPKIILSNLIPNHDYTFSVIHHNANLNIAPSDAATVDHTTDGLAAPGTPTNLATADGAAGEIAVDWDESTSNGSLVLYRTEWKLTTDSVYDGKWTFPSEYLITGLTSSSTYDIRVKGSYTNGSSSSWNTTTHTAP